MKLIIQIPCLDEATTLPATLRDLPRQVPGFDIVEWLVIDDGSSDNTADVAQQNGVDHIVRHTSHQGLARAFSSGLRACLERGADVIVNTDADNQYSGDAIPALVAPILQGSADIVVGDRNIRGHAEFSWSKKLLQRIGSAVVRRASGTEVSDTTSGFRALSREAALRLNVFTDFSYTLETLIQAGHNNLHVTSVPVATNTAVRKSRLFNRVGVYIRRSARTIVRIYCLYQPMRLFLVTGTLIGACGVALGIRFLYFFFSGSGSGHVQSVMLAAMLMLVGVQVVLTGVVADLVGVNRRLGEECLYRLRQLEAKSTDVTPP